MSDMYFYISCTVALVSLVLYIATCTIILRNLKTFSSSYYKIYIFSSVVNVVTYWNSVIAIRIPAFTCFTCSWVPILTVLNDASISRLIIFGVGYYGFLQYTISSLMAFNRFTAVFFPFKHNTFWRKSLLPLIAITIIYPLVFEFDYIIYPAEFYQVNTTAVYGIRSLLNSADFPARYRNMVIFTVCFGAFIINIILNSCVLGKIIYQRKHILKMRGSKDELRLVFHNLVSFIGEAFVALVTFMLLFKSNPSIYNLAIELVPYSCDAVSLFSPIILLFCNTEMRTKIFRKRQETVRIVSNASVTPNRR